MKGIGRFAFSAYAALICFIIINLFWGGGGVVSYNELNSYKQSLEANIYELEDINGGLILDSDKLMHQTDQIVIQARELGWIGSNEGIINIRGYEKRKAGYSMGKLLSMDKNSGRKNYINTLIPVIAGLFMFILTGFF